VASNNALQKLLRNMGVFKLRGEVLPEKYFDSFRHLADFTRRKPPALDFSFIAMRNGVSYGQDEWHEPHSANRGDSPGAG
jgi:hypothetical protein